jgi:hypothetical protein
MSEFGMVYLILVVASFLTFVGMLFWAMLATSGPGIAGHAHSEESERGGVHALPVRGALQSQKG